MNTCQQHALSRYQDQQHFYIACDFNFVFFTECFTVISKYLNEYQFFVLLES